MTSNIYRDFLKNDGCDYLLLSKSDYHDIDENFPNLAFTHTVEFDGDAIAYAKIIQLRYKEINYKMLINSGCADTNDGLFGAVYDNNNEIVINIISSGGDERNMLLLRL